MTNSTESRRPIATWVTPYQLELFRAVAASHHISPAALLRAIIVDVLAEEGLSVTIPRRHLIPDLLDALHANGKGQV